MNDNFFPGFTAADVRRGLTVPAMLVTRATQVAIANAIDPSLGKITRSLADICDVNELDIDEALAALNRTGSWVFDAGSNGDEDSYIVTIA